MVGFAVWPRKRRVSDEWIERFRPLATANISDDMSRMSAGGAGLRPLHAGGKLLGAALTVKTRPGDNLLALKAIAMAGPGDVIVIDAGGDLTNAVAGEHMIREMVRRGLGGLVVHGAVRDYDFIRQGHFPVYAAGVTHRGPYRTGPGEINVPVSLQGMIVEPGDLVIGDGDGILCIPCAHLDTICRAAQVRAEKEAAARGSDQPTDLSFIDPILKQLGCEIHTDVASAPAQPTQQPPKEQS